MIALKFEPRIPPIFSAFSSRELNNFKKKVSYAAYLEAQALK